MTRQKVVDAALALPLFGALLIMPPFVLVLVDAPSVLGIPAIVLYLFGVWVVLIGAGRRLSRRLGRIADTGPEPAGSAAAPPVPDADR